MGSPNRPKIDKTSKRRPRRSQDTPRGPPEAPKRPPRGPRRQPRGSKRHPRGTQEAPKRPLEAVKRPQEAPKTTPRSHKIEASMFRIWFWKVWVCHCSPLLSLGFRKFGVSTVPLRWPLVSVLASVHPSLQASDFPVFPLAVLGPSSCKTYPKAAKFFLPFRSSLLFFILLRSASHSTS